MSSVSCEHTPGEQVPRLVRACRHEVLDRPPVWFMRQAGRYMAEYRAVREKVSFLELCKSPELAAEVSLQPFNAFAMDAVIMFCDILIPPEAMGMELHFGDKGPEFINPIRSRQQIEALTTPDPNDEMGYVMELLRTLRRELKSHPDTALIGFAGAPWTLASYMIEGGGSKNFRHLKGMMYNEPEALRLLLDKLTTTITHYLNAQIEAGAQVVQLFDTWGGILPEPEYRQWILPYHQKILDNLNRDKAPAMLFVNHAPHLLETMVEARPDGISLDQLTPLEVARKRLSQVEGGQNLTLQGNLDPIAMLAKPEVLKPMVLDLLSQGGNQNYIFNVGHGLIPQTPPENVKLVVDTIKASSRQLAQKGG